MRSSQMLCCSEMLFDCDLASLKGMHSKYVLFVNQASFGLLYGMAILRARWLVYGWHRVFPFRDIDSSASTELHPFV